MYARRLSELIAKVLKQYLNEWLSKKMMFKAFELESNTPDESAQDFIISAFFHALSK